MVAEDDSNTMAIMPSLGFALRSAYEHECDVASDTERQARLSFAACHRDR